MISFSTSEAATLLDGSLIGADVIFDRVGSDSRAVESNSLFVAIPGERFDGHEYVGQAAANGAVAALVDHPLDAAIAQIVVGDVLHAFGELASAWRQKSDARVIGLTGSNGKTTVKEMIAAILRQQADVLMTRGNLNNDIGVPLTLTRLQDEAWAVIEMGANHPGEIRYLANLVKPDIALLNNAGRAHLEGFGSLQGVAESKAEIIEGLGKNGIFVCHGDTEWLPMWRSLAGDHKVVTFGVSEHADVRLLEESIRCEWDEKGFSQSFDFILAGQQMSLTIPLAGRHNCMNAIAAVAVAHEAGVDLQAVTNALASLKPVPGRLTPLFSERCRVLDDTYNANPDSVTAAIAVLNELPGRSVLVLGDLAELGEGAEQQHANLGEVARDAGVDLLLTLGELSRHAADAFGEGAYAAASLDEMQQFLNEKLVEGDTVLVKGSRASAMERVVQLLMNAGVQN
jgi:UDP-N-acetylmuramoyl-tripeptide--D-alanyl-D-alanine ligase